MEHDSYDPHQHGADRVHASQTIKEDNMHIVIFQECLLGGSMFSRGTLCLHLVVARDRWEALGMLHKKFKSRRVDEKIDWQRTINIGRKDAKKEIARILKNKHFADDAKFVAGLKRLARGEIISTNDFSAADGHPINENARTTSIGPPPISLFVHRPPSPKTTKRR